MALYGVEAHLELESEVVTAGRALAYRVVNDGDRLIAYGAGSVVQRLEADGWTNVSPGGWYALLRREVGPRERGPRTTLRLPLMLAAGHYRLLKDVHPPFERQGIQPKVQLVAEFAVVVA